jgi:hypothetical protein
VSNRPYSTKRSRDIIVAGPHLDDALFGAWNMKPVGGLLVDQTVQGNDGIPGAASALERTILGDFRRYEPNSGAAASALGAANAFALGDLTVNFWLRTDLGAAANAQALNYRLGATDQWGIRVNVGGQLNIFDDIDNAGATLYATAVPLGKLVHVVAVMDSLENLLYADGVLIGSGTASSDDWSSYAGVLYHGSTTAAVSPFIGIVGPLHIFNTAKDQDWVTEEYLWGARACQFKTDWGVKQSVGNEVANARVGHNSSPFEIISGTFQMTMDTIEDTEDVKTIEDIVAGVSVCPTSLFEATPTECAFGTHEFWAYKGADANNWQFMPIASDNTAVAGAAQDGYNITITGGESLRLQRIDNGAVGATLINSGAAYVANNTWYRIRLTHRYDGVFVLYIRGGAFTDWTVVGTSAADLTYTVGNYAVLDLDAGDKFAYSDRHGDHCFAKYLGVLAP